MSRNVPRYDFRCPHGHVTEAVFSMADVPASVPCSGSHTSVACMSTVEPLRDVGDALPGVDGYACTAPAARVFCSPAAIHFKGPGFYSTDVTGRLHRKRRRNAADDLPRGDSDTHALARRW